MKSIKPGRGPSGMNFVGSIIVVIFGLFWTFMAAAITAGSPFGAVGTIFPLFGVLFIILGIAQAVYSYKNATSKDRYSLFDITESGEEGDPSDKWIKDAVEQEIEQQQEESDIDANYCPYCGVQLKEGYKFCPKCGKTIE